MARKIAEKVSQEQQEEDLEKYRKRALAVYIG